MRQTLVCRDWVLSGSGHPFRQPQPRACYSFYNRKLDVSAKFGQAVFVSDSIAEKDKVVNQLRLQLTNECGGGARYAAFPVSLTDEAPRFCLWPELFDAQD
jgi:hypothetical protein